MSEYAELEIGLHRRDVDSYLIDLRYSQPGSEVDVRPLDRDPAPVRFDREALQRLEDEAAYGRQLGQSLFADERVRTALAQAQAATQAQGQSLRLRLFIGPSAPELQGLRWETLRLPSASNGAGPADPPLAASEHILFSRYLSSQDWRPVKLRAQTELRALVAVAGPDLSEYPALAAVDVAGEVARAETGLGDIETSVLASGPNGSPDQPGRVTLNNVTRRLRQTEQDILYLVCHGTMVDGTPWLWLEDDAGVVQRVAGPELVTQLQGVQRRPRLVVLASCQSAGNSTADTTADDGALASLGPRLAEAGIPAVLAMQGNITMQTVAEFMPVFFEELRRDGQIDRAMSVARAAVRNRPDWWMPALFLRIRSGRIWYTPGFADERNGFRKWQAILANIEDRTATPIVGPGLSEWMLGSQREIAQRWSEQYNFPMAPHNREDLPQVAQYLAVNQQPAFPRRELTRYIQGELTKRYGERLDPSVLDGDLAELVAAVGALHDAEAGAEKSRTPHQILAALNLPIYITTESTTLLADALAASGKEPRVELFPWNEELEEMYALRFRTSGQVNGYADEEPPSPQKPLVYHLFGRIDVRGSVVLTQDDYFRYLEGATRNKDLIPLRVRRALTDTGLLFLGFHLDEWDFRVLFHSIISREGRRRRSEYAHVAVQVDPEEGRILEPERARQYLESYFDADDISIFWGNGVDFLQELDQRLK